MLRPLTSVSGLPSKYVLFRAFARPFSSESSTQLLRTAGVFPDVIDEFKQSISIRAAYPNGSVVDMGNELKPSLTQQRPDISLTLPKVNQGKSYTLAVTDPDAPTRGDPTWSEFAHYLVRGIKPNVAEGVFDVDFSKTTELVPYMGPGPPPKTGLHRYVFLLFEEQGETSGLPSENRANWGTGNPGSGVRSWLKGQQLVPVGVNFFVAQNKEQ